MPFLTKGKTNWKYILIVVILFALIGGGILIWNSKTVCLTNSDCICCDETRTGDHCINKYFHGLLGCVGIEIFPSFCSVYHCECIKNRCKSIPSSINCNLICDCYDKNDYLTIERYAYFLNKHKEELIESCNCKSKAQKGK
jgi:hypothetical protein